MKITKAHLKDYSKIYDTFYEHGYDEWLVDFGDRILKEYNDITSAFIQARKDFLTSDREVAAYAVWFLKHHMEIERSMYHEETA